jgi:hypothetical protein
MKRFYSLIVIVLISFFVLGMGGESAAQPFAKPAKHRLVIKQSKRAIKRAQAGKTYYKRNKRGNVKRHWL